MECKRYRKWMDGNWQAINAHILCSNVWQKLNLDKVEKKKKMNLMKSPESIIQLRRFRIFGWRFGRGTRLGFPISDAGRPLLPFKKVRIIIGRVGCFESNPTSMRSRLSNRASTLPSMSHSAGKAGAAWKLPPSSVRLPTRGSEEAG